MEQPTESPLTPLGQQLLSEHATRSVDQPLAREWQPPYSQPMSASGPAALFLWLAVPFLLIDLLLGPVSILELELRGQVGRVVGAMAIGFWMGLIAAQITFLNLYAALSPESIWQRLLVVVPQIVVYGAAGIVGFAFVLWYEAWYLGAAEFDNVTRFYCLMPLLTLAGQTPFLCLRAIFGWTLIPVVREPAEQPAVHSRLSIANLMIATAAVAAALGIVRMAPLETLGDPAVLWTIVAVFSGILAGFSLIGGITLLVLLHFVRSTFARLSWIAGLLLLAAAVSWAIYGWLTSWRELWREGPFNTLIFGIIIVTFLGSLSGLLHWLRRQGWQVGPARTVLDP